MGGDVWINFFLSTRERERGERDRQERMKTGGNGPVEVKVCIIGESDVGKTSLSMR